MRLKREKEKLEKLAEERPDLAAHLRSVREGEQPPPIVDLERRIATVGSNKSSDDSEKP